MATDPGRLVGDLVAAFNARDGARWAALFSPDAALSIPGLTEVRGADQLRGFLDFFDGMNGRWEARSWDGNDRRITAVINHRDDFAATMGLAAVQFDRVELELDDDGRIASFTAALTEETADALGAAVESFLPWALQQDAGIMDESGAFIYTREAGEAIVRSAHDFLEQAGG